MNPRLSIFGIVFLLLLVFAGYALTGCTSTDRNAGMVVAREMGQTRYLAIERNGERDSVAVFPFRGTWHWYHPGIASVNTGEPLTNPPPHQVWLCPNLKGVSGRWSWEPVGEGDAVLSHACLPQAIAEVRERGGRVVLHKTNAFRVP